MPLCSESSSKTESQELPHPWTGKGGCPTWIEFTLCVRICSIQVLRELGAAHPADERVSNSNFDHLKKKNHSQDTASNIWLSGYLKPDLSTHRVDHHRPSLWFTSKVSSCWFLSHFSKSQTIELFLKIILLSLSHLTFSVLLVPYLWNQSYLEKILHNLFFSQTNLCIFSMLL